MAPGRWFWVALLIKEYLRPIRILAIAEDLREQRGGPLIDPTAEWVPPGLTPSLTRPNDEPAPEDDGPLYYVEPL